MRIPIENNLNFWFFVCQVINILADEGIVYFRCLHVRELIHLEWKSRMELGHLVGFIVC